MTMLGQASHNGGMDLDAFARDGYVAIRGAFAADTAAACREAIWASLTAERGVRPDDPARWPGLAQISCPDGEPFAVAGTSPALLTAYDELIGPGRWWRRPGVGGAVVVRFPSQDRGNAGYHVEGSYEGPGGYWVNVRSKARGLLALFLFSDVGIDDAPTRLVCGSHVYVPEFLAPFGEDGTPADREFWRPSVLCRPMAHATGHAGDVFLCHPFLVHTATWPHWGSTPRMIAQPGVYVEDGFSLDGSDPSPVAKAIVAGLEMAR
jgi:hypothetical protein